MPANVIDSKVVEMKFDNSKFDKNVKETMSLLDKLKQALKFDGASDGMKSLERTANSLNFDKAEFAATKAGFHIQDVWEKVTRKFEQDIAGRITNAAENMWKSLTTEQISVGYSKYDEKIASVQTLVNSTGKSVEEINKYLDQLMWYSDETSYSFTEMTSALAQMTSTGGDIDKLIPTITGIANATAYAGKSGEAFVHTIRNLTQSYNAGYLQLMDWKSLNLAGTSSKQLTEQLIKAAEELGTVQKGMLTVENFAEKLKNKNITTDVMDLAFSRFSAMSQEAYKLVQSGKFETASEAIEAIADDFDELASRAFKSAQEAKSFTEAIDATKDAVSSGWMSTFEVIFGNYAQAKELWTDLANGMWDFFAGGAEGRNNRLADILGDNWDRITQRINDAGVSTEEFETRLEEVAARAGLNTDTIIDYYGSMGEWMRQTGEKNSHFIRETLLNMAYVTKEVGDEFKITSKDIEDFNKIIDNMASGKIKNATTALNQLTKAGFGGAEAQKMVNEFYETGGKDILKLKYNADSLKDSIVELSKKQVSAFGYTEEQIESLKELAAESGEADSELNDLTNRIGKEKDTGRTLLFDAIGDSLATVVDLINLAKEAFANMFPSSSASVIYNIIKAIRNAAGAIREFVENEDNADKIRRKFEGLFAVLDIIKTLVGGALKVVFSIFKTVLEELGLKSDGLSTSIADNIVAFRDWIKETVDFDKVIEVIIPKVREIVSAIKSWFDEGGKLNNILKAGEELLIGFKDKLTELFNGFMESDDKVGFLIESFKMGFKEGIPSLLEFLTYCFEELFGGIIDFFSKDDQLEESGEEAVGSLKTGFKKGIKEFLSEVKSFGSKVIDTFKNLPWEQMFAIGLSIAMISFVSKFGKLLSKIESLLQPFTNLMNNLSSVVGSFNKLLTQIGKSLMYEAIGDMVLKIAISIGIIALAIKVLSTIDGKKALVAVGVLTAIFVYLIILVVVISEFIKDMAAINPIAATAVIMSFSLLLSSLMTLIIAMSAIVVILSVLPNIEKGLRGLAVICLILMAVVLAITEIAKGAEGHLKEIATLSGLMLSLATFFLLTAIAMKMIGKLDDSQFNKAITTFVVMGLMIMALMGVAQMCHDMPDKLDKFAEAMSKMAIAMLLAAIAMKIVGSLDDNAFGKGMIFLTAMVGFLALIVLITKMISYRKALVEFGTLCVSLGAAMILTAIAIKMISKLSIGEIAKGVVFLLGFVGFIALLSLVTKIGAKTIKGFSKMLISFSAAMILLALSVKLLAGMDPSDIIKGELAVLGLAGIMRLLISSFKGFGKEAPKIALALLAATFCIGLMAVIVFLLGQLKVETLAKGLTAIGLLTLFMDGLIIATKFANTKDIKNNLIGLAICIAVLAGSLAVVSLIPTEKLLPSVAALVILMGMLGVLIIAISKIGGGTKTLTSVVVKLVVLGLLIAELAGVLYLLGKCENPAALLPAALGMSALLLALVYSFQVLSKIKGKISTDAIIGLAALGVAVAAIALVIGGLQKLGIEVGLENALALSTLLIALTVALAVLSAIGGMATGALAAIGVLDLLIADLAIVFTGLGYIFSEAENLEAYLDKGIEIMGKLGKGLGMIFGGFIEGIGEGIIDLIPLFGEALSQFWVKAGVFFRGVANLPEGTTEGAKNMADAIMSLTKAELINGLVGFITGFQNPQEFTSLFQALGDAMIELTKSFSNVRPEQLSRVEMGTAALASVMEVVNSLPRSGGLAGCILGDKDFGTFITNLTAFGPSVAALAENLKDIDDDKTKRIKSSGEAIMAIADIANALPKLTAGTLSGFLFGDKETLAQFGSNLPAFGNAVYLYSKAITEGEGLDTDAIKESVKAVEKLVEMANKLPKGGGKVKEWFDGETISMDKFGEQLTLFGVALVEFSEQCKNVLVDRIEAVLPSVDTIVEIANKLSDNADKFTWFTSDKNTSLAGLGGQLKSLAIGLNDFASNVNTANIGILNTVTPILDRIMRMCIDICTNSGFSVDKISEFVQAIDALSTINIHNLIAAFTLGKDDIGVIDESTIPLITQLVTGIINGIDTVNAALDTLLDSMKSKIESRGIEFELLALTKIMGDLGGFATGIKLSYSTINFIIDIVLAKAKSEIESKYEEFYEAGAFLMTGLALGISDSVGTVIEATVYVANAVASALKGGLEEKSPSKLSYKFGKYWDQGLALGIKDYSGIVTEEATKLADLAIEGLRTSVDNIYDVIDWDLNPVITPALDLTYLEEGVNTIDRMFGSKSLDVNAEGQNGEQSSTGNVYNTFTQNNYSPKALSRMEIYRQTRNQIAQVKGVLRNNG